MTTKTPLSKRAEPIKDCSNPQDYEFPSDFPPDRWAWEFLRRNGKYQAEWYTQHPKFLRAVYEEDPELFVQVQGKWSFATFDWIPKDPSAPDFIVWSEHCWNSWRLPGYCNPETDAPEYVSFSEPSGYRWPPAMVLRESIVSSPPIGAESANPSRVVAFIDLRCSIGNQIKKIEERVILLQKNSGIKPQQGKEIQKEKWPFFLRLLDARAARITYTGIIDAFGELDPLRPGEVLDEKLVQERWQAACDLTEPKGYLSIVGVPSVSDE